MWIYISREHCLIFIHQIWLFEILITAGYNQTEKHGFFYDVGTRLSFVLFWAFSHNDIFKVYILLELMFLWISVLIGYSFLTSFPTLWLLGFLICHCILYKKISEPQFSCYCPFHSFHLSFSHLQPWIFKCAWLFPVMLWVICEFLEGRHSFVMDIPWDWNFAPSPNTTQLL